MMQPLKGITFMNSPNIIRLAVTAAGGPSEVAPKFKLTPRAIQGWCARKSMPAECVRPLCQMGKNAISPDQVLAYIEQCKGSATESA